MKKQITIDVDYKDLLLSCCVKIDKGEWIEIFIVILCIVLNQEGFFVLEITNLFYKKAKIIRRYIVIKLSKSVTTIKIFNFFVIFTL